MFFVRLVKWLTGQICCSWISFINSGRRAGTYFTCTQNLEEEKPGHSASPRTHLLPQRRACVYASHCLSTGVCRGECSLKHIMGDRGETQWHLSLTVRSPWTHSPQRWSILPTSRAFNSADPFDLLQHPSPPPPPPTVSPLQHYASTSLSMGGALSTSWNNTPALPTEVAGGCVEGCGDGMVWRWGEGGFVWSQPTDQVSSRFCGVFQSLITQTQLSELLQEDDRKSFFRPEWSGLQQDVHD